jgi:Aldehyde dehydrogenase family
MQTEFRAIVQSEYGAPEKVLKIAKRRLKSEELGVDDALVKVIARPIHHGDIQILSALPQGGPVEPIPEGTLRVPGFEGVGTIVRLGTNAKGAKRFSEGQRVAFFPAIVYPVSWDDPIMEDEVFGPILPILTYRTLDEAFGRISAAPRPLAAFIFSRSQSAIDRFVGELSFGGGAVNQVNIHLFVETMPFGGVGPAGMGHYYGKYGFDMLTHAKSMLISPPDVAIEHLFPPYSPEKNTALKMWFTY